ncbi:MAG TPA: MBL fold metallo-hydrolase, partial [Pseudomonadales bacterium]|nr:MBL fold metallo-hydrolase [Pseudomonadales bacterium]
ICHQGLSMAFWKRWVGLHSPAPHWYTSSCQHETTAEPVEITYLGTAGFVIQGAARTLVLDPYISRPGLPGLLTEPLVPDEALIQRLLPHADDVLIGHAHYDHILDAPALCRHTGARLIGSQATIMVGRAAGLPEQQMRMTAGREDIACGQWTVRGLPSLHGKVMGRIPFPGDITALPPWPPRVHHLKHGLVLNWLVDTGGLRIMHIDSADFIPAEMANMQVDVVCLCAIGRSFRPNYVKEVVSLLKPRWIIPCHWDTMLTPLEAEPDLIPGVDIPGFLDEIRAEGVEPLLTPILGKQRFGKN